MSERAFLSVFTPSRTRPEDLEAIHVQRHSMLADAVERVREGATTGNKHHLLYVGPRGTGKTHLVTVLVHRLDRDRTLEARLRIAWLNEDETSTSLLELLRRIYLALAKRHPAEFPRASIDPMFDMAADEAERWLAQLLLEKLQERALLVVVENLDALFAGLGKPGQQKLRAFVQEHPVMSIVATAQRLVDDLSKRDKAFFGFFQTEHLKTLSVEQAAELLGKIATLNGQPEVAAFLHGVTGRARIRALHHLSGGNHRIYIVLSQFITRDSIDALVGPFVKMIDEMTPYYQERIRWLPTQQRKIVEYLCGRERPTPVKEVARRLFASQQTISSQLKDLRRKGYVQAAARGRESLYEIAEPLMRLCVEVKENQSHAPLRVLVDFLRVWYEGRELAGRLEKYRAGSVARGYLESAIEHNAAQGGLRAQLLVESYRAELGEERGRVWNSRIESYAQESEELALACGEWAKGNDTAALAALEEITDEKAKRPDSIKASAWLLAAEIHYRKHALESAIQCLDTLLTLSDPPAEQVAMALVYRGATYGQLGDSERAIADYSAVIDRPGTPAERVAMALVNRGVAYGELGDSERAIADYSAVIDRPGTPAERVAMALVNRGVAYGQLGDSERAIADYSAVIDRPGTPAERVAMALVNRGVAYGQLGDSERAIADYSAVIDRPGTPAERVAMALVNRGVAYGKLGDSEREIAGYSAAIDLAGAPAEKVAKALFRRGVAYSRLGDREREIADYDAVIDLAGAPSEQVAKVLVNRGVAYGQLGDWERAINDFSAVIDLAGAPAMQVALGLYGRGWSRRLLKGPGQSGKDFETLLRLEGATAELSAASHLALAEMRIADGRWDPAMASLAEGLKESIGVDQPHAGDSTAVIDAFFESATTPAIRRRRCRELAALYRDNDSSARLGEALTRHLGALHGSGEEPPAADNLERWASAWEEAGRDIDELRPALRILRTGVNFLKTGGRDRGILLDLNQEERKVLEQALNLDAEC